MYIYPDNLRAKPTMWLWQLRDITVIGVLALVAVLIFSNREKSFRFCRPHVMHFCPSALKIPAFSTLSGIRCPTIW